MENHKQLKLSLKMAIFIPPQYLLHCVDFGVFICCLSCHTVCVLCYCCQTCLVSFDYSVYNNNLHRITKYSHESVMVGEQRRTNCIGLSFHAFAVCIVFKQQSVRALTYSTQLNNTKMHNSWHLTSSAFIWSILLHYSHQHYFQFLLHEFHYIHYIFLSQSQPTARRKFESHLLSLYHFFSIWITLAGLFVHCTVMSHAKKRQHNKRLDAAAHRQQQTAISGNNTINH